MQAGTSLFQQGERISAALGVFTVGNVGQGDVRAAGIEDVVGQVEVGGTSHASALGRKDTSAAVRGRPSEAESY